MTGKLTPTELLENPWAFGPWCYQIGVVVRCLPEPIKVPRGMLGMWPLTLDVQAVIRHQLGVSFDVVERAVTLQQPYATAIVGYRRPDGEWEEGPKRVENRPKPVLGRTIPTGGRWLAIHAGKALYPNAAEIVADWRGEGSPYSPPGRHLYASEFDVGDDDDSDPNYELWMQSPRLEDMPRSAILGVMRVDHCLPYPGAWVASSKREGVVDLNPPTRGVLL